MTIKSSDGAVFVMMMAVTMLAILMMPICRYEAQRKQSLFAGPTVNQTAMSDVAELSSKVGGPTSLILA